MISFKSHLKRHLPSAVWNRLRRLRRDRIRWSGNFNSWQEAERACRGYASPDVLSKVSLAVSAVLRGEATFERDGTLFDQAEPNQPLIEALRRAELVGGAPVIVVDFGGSLGSTYLQNRAYVQDIDLRWTVIEQPHFVERGRELYQPSGDVKFARSADEIHGVPSLLILSSVLQYMKDPEQTLVDLVHRLKPLGIFIDRTPFIAGPRSRLTIQKVPASMVSSSYPCWFLSRDIIEIVLSSSYEKVTSFPALDECIDFESSFEGSFWIKKNS